VNAVEIEQAVTALVEAPFDAAEFPYAFLEAFGNKPTTIKRLRSGSTNKSDLGGVLQRSNIHIKVCEPGEATATLEALRESPATASQKAKYVLATDGEWLEAENLVDGSTLPCKLVDLPNHFGFFLPLAGITTVQQIKENAFDIRATGRLNKLYVELLRHNPGWDSEERREDLNHFFARLIFCFFAEDTNIFHGKGLFTNTIAQMSEPDGSNVHEIIGELFHAMNTPLKARTGDRFRPWANTFPYVNGGLFSSEVVVPRFSKMARSYLLHIGGLDWTRINPDIFGSMIQAVAEDEERGELGMHYTSVPNILKVLNPLFLDDLREKLDEAGDGDSPGSKRKLLNLRSRIARIRVFDPACGSGNFLVIAYKEMREIEHDINTRRGEPDRRSDIPLTNFRGIEIRHFAAEIARLALVIAEFQCDVNYRGERMALLDFLPLDGKNWIVHGNALRLDWLDICPPTGTGLKLHGDDLFRTPLGQAEMDFENEGGETYICGNPPYTGSKRQDAAQKDDLAQLFANRCTKYKSLDYVTAWFLKASDYARVTPASIAFVATNSVCQGQQASILWPLIFAAGQTIFFAHTSFNWKNLASRNAGVTVVVVGFTAKPHQAATLYSNDKENDCTPTARRVTSINAYLVPGGPTFVNPTRTQLSSLPTFDRGNSPTDGGHLILQRQDTVGLGMTKEQRAHFIRPFVGSSELIAGIHRYCIWIDDNDVEVALSIPSVASRMQAVADFRASSNKEATRRAASTPHRFDERKPLPSTPVLCVPITSSQARPFLPADLLPPGTVISNLAFSMPHRYPWAIGLCVSRMLLVWVSAIYARMRTDYRFTNTLCWNTFPVPPLTEQNKADLTRCAEGILLARESYWPATIADMYDPEDMDARYPALRAAHEANDETLERIYIGRRFRNDTERLEKLFEMYTKMVAKDKPGGKKPHKKRSTRNGAAK